MYLLLNLNRYDKFEKSLVIIENMDDDITILKSVFNKYDQDASGWLNNHQFTLLLARLGKYVPELKGVEIEVTNAVFAYLNVNGDGKMSFDEFQKWWYSRCKKPTSYSYFMGKKGQLLRKAYTLYKKYTGISINMSYEQFNKMLDEMKITHGDDEFDRLDQDNNGVLSFSEFCNWLDWF